MADKKKIVVAMSGGVDSSTAAALLKDEGHEVIGVSMQLWDYAKKDAATEEKDGAREGSCCSLDDLYDARRVADKLGIPFYVVNVEELFSKEVVDYFVKSYLAGETPNPCVKCNEIMKFKALLNKAKALGADYLATGHYARLKNDGGRVRLFKGKDSSKDQSYFLFTMTEEERKSVVFPLGDYTKAEVRKLAKKFGLRVHEKKESQEICFIEDDNYARFVSSSVAARKGEITDSSGKVLGEHEGLFRYTIGQRKGINIKDGKGPYYVVGMDMAANRLVVGRSEELFANGLRARGANWIAPRPSGKIECEVKIRFRHAGVPSLVSTDGDNVSVEFLKPEKSVTPGQAAVFYDGDEVLGGAWIVEAIK